MALLIESELRESASIIAAIDPERIEASPMPWSHR